MTPARDRPHALHAPLAGPAVAAFALALAVVFAPAAHAGDTPNKQQQPPRYDPTLEVPPPAPLPKLKAPSPGNSEPGSPVRGYIYGPPADSGAITNRLVPPSTIRR